MLLTAFFACAPIPSGASDTQPFFTADSSPQDTGVDTDTGDTGTSLTWPITLTLTVDDDVATMVRARWTLVETGKRTWVEFRFDDGDWMSTPSQTATLGQHETVLLGIPAEADVDARLVVETDEPDVRDEASIKTGQLPSEVPEPILIDWDETRTLDANWILATVDSSNNAFQGPYFVEIFDRLGRVVWYHEVPDELAAFYNGVALDGTHLWFDASAYFDGSDDGDGPRFTRMTLDGRYFEEIAAPLYHLGVDEMADGSFVYGAIEGGEYSVNVVAPDGDDDLVWSCSDFMASIGVTDGSACAANTVVWDAARNTAFYSMFVSNTVMEIDIDDGSVLKQFGQLTEGDPWTIDPIEAMVVYQHYVNWTADGTILASTHLLGEVNVQAANEYAVDEATQTLQLVWQYKTSDRYATHTGEAHRLANGNTFIGYGTGGALREMAEQDVVWEVEWGLHHLGHAEPVASLYDLNRGP
jgi:hypothetical protein